MNIFIEVIGCTANQSDACIARYIIVNDPNLKLVDSVVKAKCILLFTCTVISSTEQRMLSKIKNYYKQKKQVIVTGCMSQIQADLIKEISEDIILIPLSHIHYLSLYLSNNENNIIDHMKNQHPKLYISPIAPISISEGCNFSCSYCITTLARGKLQSYSSKEIKQDVTNAIKQGCKELQLTAQDTASYGRDTGTSLAQLLTFLTQIPGWYRFRVGMMNPATVIPQLDDLIDAFDHDHIYKFLHLPIQSGDDNILKFMGRQYTIDEVFLIVKQFRNRFSNITLATDVIVGFPNEQDFQYQNTKDVIVKLQPDIVNITKFSARPNTKAKTMSHRIPTDIVKRRSIELTKITAEISYNKNKNHIGNQYSILITEKGKNKSMIGRTNQYKPIVINDPVYIGDIVEVEIIDAKQTYLVGTLK